MRLIEPQCLTIVQQLDLNGNQFNSKYTFSSWSDTLMMARRQYIESETRARSRWICYIQPTYTQMSADGRKK